MTYPQVNLDPSDPVPAILQWFPVRKGQTDGGELLFAAELFLVSLMTDACIESPF